MKSRLIAISTLLSATFFLVGCLQSPLLHHADAASKARASAPRELSQCTLTFSQVGLCASLDWVKMPAEDEKGEFTLRFWNQNQGTENGPYVDPAQTVFVKLFMPAMGHGSSPVRTSQLKDNSGSSIPGIFDVSEVYFVMPGAWQIIVQLRNGQQTVDQAILNVEI